MDIQQLIRSRRTVHEFDSARHVSADAIKQAIDAACWAPNHHLTEPWHFYLLGQETAKEICELNREVLTATKGSDVAEQKYQRWMQMPGWLVVSCDKSDDELRFREDYAACCCAMQNFMLALWAEGIGVKWSTGSITREERFYELVWVDPEVEQIIGLFWYGYPAVVPQTVRKTAAEVLVELP